MTTLVVPVLAAQRKPEFEAIMSKKTQLISRLKKENSNQARWTLELIGTLSSEELKAFLELPEAVQRSRATEFYLRQCLSGKAPVGT
jgi:hypothetical protein